MSGPHHYFGWINPRKYHVIEYSGGGPVYIEVDPDDISLEDRRRVDSSVGDDSDEDATSYATSTWSSGGSEQRYTLEEKMSVSDAQVLRITDYDWINGKTIDAETRKSYAINYDETAVLLIDTNSGAADSLFANPGILEVDHDELQLPLLEDAYNYDLSSFRAQVVPNHLPFAFNQELVSLYKHAQHRLRVITYNYADGYKDDYLMHGSGVFIERHEFIQAITPVNRQCGGFVILGREVEG